MIKISRRGMVRLISFFVAAIAVLAIFTWKNSSENAKLKDNIKYGYMRAMEDLSLSIDNIKTSLNKGSYAASPEMLSDLTGRMWSDASTAKVSLSQLPVEKLNLESTYKFLSQVGNYAKSISTKVGSGATISEEEKQNLTKLLGYCNEISQSCWDTVDKMNQGFITFDEVKDNVKQAGEETDSQSHITDGFRDFEDGFQEYPSLIYDGPFSDHILQKEPEMTKGKAEVSREQALEKAKKATGISDLENDEDTAGRMPTFNFKKDSTTAAVTKNGGLLTYVLKYREFGETVLTTDEAVKKATEYLNNLGIKNIDESYFEVRDGLCIINFATVENNVTMYTDLIKVGVAMDNGEIMSYDARGYIMNKKERKIDQPKLNKEAAQLKVSRDLKIEGTKLCVIPSEGQNELYTYEFKCSAPDGKPMLVYVNADTGKEEKILILLISENGTLTA